MRTEPVPMSRNALVLAAQLHRAYGNCLILAWADCARKTAQIFERVTGRSVVDVEPSELDPERPAPWTQGVEQ